MHRERKAAGTWEQDVDHKSTVPAGLRPRFWGLFPQQSRLSM